MFVIFAVILLGVWLQLSGHYDTFTILLGMISIATVIFLAKRMGLLKQGQHTLHFYSHLPAYGIWLLPRIIVANFDVAWRILHPKLPINPGFIRTPMTQKKELAKLTHANSITLTPGTISTDIDTDSIEVHVLTRCPTDEISLLEFDRRASMLEGDKKSNA